MSKTKTIKKIFLFVVAMVMMASPVLLAGCSWFKFGPSNQTSPVTPSNPSGGGNGGGNSGGDSGNSQTPSPTDSIYDPPEDNAVDLDNYDQYFQNYRITYVPGAEVDRTSFTYSLGTQNQQVTNAILDDLKNKYGDISVDFDKEIDNIVCENDNINYYLVYNSDGYYIVQYEDSDYKKYFTHKDAINEDVESDGITPLPWQWNERGESESVEFTSQQNQNKLQLAEYLILSGKILNEDGSNFTEDSSKDFVSAYSQYFTNTDLAQIKPEYLTKDDNDNDVLNLDALSDVVSQIDHLGFTETEQQYLANFVLNYIIGQKLVETDNKRFVNAYSTDGENLTIVYNANSADSNKKAGKINNNLYYNRFLTDETYATGELVDNEEIEFTISDTNKNLEGICYYAGEYLKKSSQNNVFNLDEDTLKGPLSSSRFAVNLIDGGEEKNVTSAVYDNLINVYGTAVDFAGKKQFNANVWNYDQNNDGEADETVTIDDPQNHQTYALFSIRLPYFKNYYNTVSFMIRDMFGELTPEKKSALDQEWQESKGMNYPYDSLFPNVPFSYFADYDNQDILFNEETGLIEMYSGYMAYQTLVIMPIKPIYVKNVALFFIREPLENEKDMDGTGDFEITVYARYYDAETKSYATWGDENNEFYLIDKVNIVYEEDLDKDTGESYCVPIPLEIDTREILTTAKINGSERGTYLLGAMAEDNKVFLHEENLISVANYGWWFNKIQTPEGDMVVCYDGNGTNSESYLEFVFANPDGREFQVCFNPYDCYKE